MDSEPLAAFPTDDDDTISGSRQRDRISALAGDDVVRGKGGADTLRGDAGDDGLFGNGGKDRLFGGSGDDRLIGGKGNDKLVGGTGLDTLNGGGGRDKLIGGADGDTLKGGGGADLFIYKTLSDGIDTIVDFDLDQGDALNLRKLFIGVDEAAPEDVARLRTEGGDTILAVSPDADGTFSDLVRLRGGSLDLQDLLDAGAIKGLPDDDGSGGPTDPTSPLEIDIPDQVVEEGASAQLFLEDFVRGAAQGEDLTIDVTENAAWIRFDQSSGILRARPGTYSEEENVEVAVTGESGGTATANFSIAVHRLDAPEGDDERPGGGPGGVGDTDIDTHSTALAGQGRFVAFASQYDLIGNASRQGNSDIFVADFATPAGSPPEQLSVGQGQSYSPTISADGRFVAFLAAPSEPPTSVGVPPNTGDAFLVDRADPEGRAILISAAEGSSAPTQGVQTVRSDFFDGRPVMIAADGERVAFLSRTKLDAGHGGNGYEVYVRELDSGQPGSLTLVSTERGSIDGNATGNTVALSADGRVIAYDTGPNLGTGELTGSEVRVHSPSIGALTVDGAAPVVSASGRYVAFQAEGAVYRLDLTASSDPGLDFVGIFDVLGREVASPSMSGDGRFIAFSDRDNVFVRDMQSGETHSLGGGEDDLYDPSLSEDGSLIAYVVGRDVTDLLEDFVVVYSSSRSGATIRSDVPDDEAIQLPRIRGGSSDLVTAVRSDLDRSGDRDLFELEGAGSFRIDLEGASTGQGTLADPFLRVFDAGGREIGSDDDGGAGLDASLIVGSSGTISISVEAIGGATGTYRLRVREADEGVADEPVAGDRPVVEIGPQSNDLTPLLVDPTPEPIV